MKKLLTCLTLFSVFCTVSAMAATATLTGFVTDSMCGKSHMMEGKTAAQCVRACVKGGAKYALYSGDKLYILNGKSAQLDAVAGKNVKVTGELTGDTITVSSVAEVK